MGKAGSGTGKCQSLEFALIPQVPVNGWRQCIAYHGAAHD